MKRLKIYAELMRINRPVGTLLLLWPTLAALWMASSGLPTTELLVIFGVGTFIMRSAGCVINDIVDRDVDPYVERTSERPLARRAIGVGEALVLAIVLFAIGGALAYQLSTTTLIWAGGGAVLALIYPFAKRFTYLPQVILGAAFSWGIVLAFIEVQGAMTSPAWILFVGSLLWIVAYDTFYAMVDREDDIQIGVKSTAVLFGDGAITIVLLLQLSVLGVWYLVGSNMEYHYPYYIALAAIAALFLMQQLTVQTQPSLDEDDAVIQRRAYLKAFKSNTWVGLALFFGVVAELTLLPMLHS